MDTIQNENQILYVLTNKFIPSYTINDFRSLIWAERYWECGDFELEVLYNLELVTNVKVGNYLALGNSSNIMVIESMSIMYEVDDKSNRYIVYKGRTMESILDRRIMWGEWIYEGKDLQVIIKDLLDKCIISPEDKGRKIDFFRFSSSSDIPEILLTLTGDGDDLYTIIQAICQEKQIGMKCSFDETSNTVVFSLYRGKDRSYDQLVNPPVIFSSEYENLGPSRYSLDTSKFKTVALAVSPWRDSKIEDEDGNVIDTETTRTVIEVGDFSVTGLNRRELFVSCSSGYPEDMAQEAMEEIANLNRLEGLDSELDPKRQFIYNKDYTIGDIVQVVTDFGLDAKAIVTEFIRYWSESGYTEVPTFKFLTKDDVFNAESDQFYKKGIYIYGP